MKHKDKLIINTWWKWLLRWCCRVKERCRLVWRRRLRKCLKGGKEAREARSQSWWRGSGKAKRYCRDRWTAKLSKPWPSSSEACRCWKIINFYSKFTTRINNRKWKQRFLGSWRMFSKSITICLCNSDCFNFAALLRKSISIISRTPSRKWKCAVSTTTSKA